MKTARSQRDKWMHEEYSIQMEQSQLQIEELDQEERKEDKGEGRWGILR